MTTLPFHRVNVLTGTKGARIIEEPAEYAGLIKKAKRPLLVLGPRVLSMSVEGKLLLEYALEVAKARNIPICATAHVKKKMLELGTPPESVCDIVEIINHLQHPAWQGVKKEGNHDLVLFLGFRTDLGNQGLSTLKHFAPHLKTMTLCKYYYPNADYSLPNLRRDKQWKQFLETLITEIRKEE